MAGGGGSGRLGVPFTLSLPPPAADGTTRIHFPRDQVGIKQGEGVGKQIAAPCLVSLGTGNALHSLHCILVQALAAPSMTLASGLIGKECMGRNKVSGFLFFCLDWGGDGGTSSGTSREWI